MHCQCIAVVISCVTHHVVRVGCGQCIRRDPRGLLTGMRAGQVVQSDKEVAGRNPGRGWKVTVSYVSYLILLVPHAIQTDVISLK